MMNFSLYYITFSKSNPFHCFFFFLIIRPPPSSPLFPYPPLFRSTASRPRRDGGAPGGEGDRTHQGGRSRRGGRRRGGHRSRSPHAGGPVTPGPAGLPPQERSEEHTSELQSQSNIVCRLLLEKKKQ